MDTAAEAIRQKKLAALASVGSAVALVSLKAFLAAVTGSLGVLSEALHSILDLVAAVITFLSVRVSDKPADADHQFGHGKVENFSAFLETGLLLLTALYIIWEAMRRLLFHEVHLHPSVPAILILVLAMGIDLVRARALGRVARKFPSEALEADALHFSTDVWSTFVVIVGITAAYLGERFGIAWLAYADAIAALGVAGVILWVGTRLGKRTIDALLDVAPVGLQQEITGLIAHVSGVSDVRRVRVRRAGTRYFVDATIAVPRSAGIEQAHSISEAVERRIEQIVPADVTVHVEPRAPAAEDLFDTIRAIAQRRGFAIHELSAYQLERRLYIELHLEVDERASLREAHARATELENDIRREADRAAEVTIHLEPLGSRIAPAEEMKGLGAAVQEYINTLPSEFSELMDCHQVLVRSTENKIRVACHCAMQGDLPISQIHDVIAELEDRVREKFPQISRITIHPEPPEER